METMANANKTPLKKLDFEYGFRPVYYFSRLTGFWPFSIIRHSDGTIQKARIGFFDILWSILLICLYLIFAFFAYEVLKVGRDKNEDNIRFYVYNVFKMGSVLFGIFGIILDMRNRNKLVDILRKFNTFDNEVSILFTDFS